MGQFFHLVFNLLSWLHQNHPNTTEQIACGVLLLCFLPYIAKASPSSNGYALADCIPSKGPGPQNRPCQVCFDRIFASELSIKHKPCRRAFHLSCYLDWINASMTNLDTPLCPVCLSALLTYEQTLQLFLWRFSQRQKRFFWRLYLNAVVCGDWLALAATAGIVALLTFLLMVSQGLGRYRRHILVRLEGVVANTLGRPSYTF